MKRSRPNRLGMNTPDARCEAATVHVEGLEVINHIAGKRAPTKREKRRCYFDFLAGWDAAMEIRFEELLEENTELHARLIEAELKKRKNKRKPTP